MPFIDSHITKVLPVMIWDIYVFFNLFHVAAKTA